MSSPAGRPLPDGFGVRMDDSTVEIEPGVWFGGSPARVMRVTAAGRRAWETLRTGPVASRDAGVLARRLTDAGLAQPCPPPARLPVDVTVVIPVRDRADSLDACLAGLGRDHPVLVVDDASREPSRIAEVCARHGATLVRRDRNGGPGAARDTGLRRVDTEYVAFVDSDCVPGPGWIDRLAAHLADPAVAAVAPRIRAVTRDPGDDRPTAADRYSAARCGLDLGGAPARVAPGTRVSYVPTAALVVRRRALEDVARDGHAFDPALRVGEDVDLVWRLHEAGWRVRYEPSVEVGHREPAEWSALLARRFRYGTSAAPLALRHPEANAPLVVHPWLGLTVAAALAFRPLVAAGAFSMAVAQLSRVLREADVPRRNVVRSLADGAYQTWLGAGRYAIQFAAPALVAAVATPGRASRRIAAASLLLAPPVAAWLGDRDSLDPARYVAGFLADEIAYGAGVWAGCLRGRTLRPIRPRVLARPLQADPARADRR